MNLSWSSNITQADNWFGLNSFSRWPSRFPLYTLSVLLFLVINVFLLMFYLGPTYRDALSAEASLSSTRSDLSQMLAYQKAQQDLVAVQQMFLDPQKLAELANWLPELAGSHNLSIPQVNYEQERGKNGYFKRVSIRFDLIGQYPDIRKFIHDLEKRDAFLFIEEMSIVDSGEERGLIMEIELLALIR